MSAHNINFHGEIRIEMCQYSKDATAQGLSSPGNKHFAKKKKKEIVKRATDRFYPQLNLTFIL